MSLLNLSLDKKSVALFGTGSTGNQFFRLIRPGKALERRGWKIYGFHVDNTQHHVDMWQAHTNDVSRMANMEWMIRQSYFAVFQLVQSRLATTTMEVFRDLTRIPILTDMDDDPFNVDAWNPGVRTNTMGEPYQLCAAEQLKLSSGVLVSTERLRQVALEYNPLVWVVPNTVDQIWKQVKNAPSGKRIRIGWQGASAHLGNVRLLKYVVPKILEQFPNVEWYFWSPVPPEWLPKHPRVLVRKDFVTMPEYPKTLASLGFDIAVCPLQDTWFNRAKSNIRWMDHSVLKTPSVCSRVEPYQCVKEGVDGFLAQEEDEWVAKLSKLIGSEVLRRKIGKAAAKRVWTDFGVDKMVAVYEKIYRHFLPLNQELIRDTHARFAEARAKEAAQQRAPVRAVEELIGASQ